MHRAVSPISFEKKLRSNDERPRKRGKTSAYTPSIQQVALEEIDLEISIRRRISEAIHSRLTWASLLQDTLKHSSGQPSKDIWLASLDALDAIEAPCDPIFNRESRLALLPLPYLPTHHVPPPVFPAQPLHPPQDNISSGSRLIRNREVARALPSSKRFLFLCNTTPPEIVKLVCPQCSRVNFSNLQGLLNHCRLQHQLEYGSHDECVQSCAVLVPKEEHEWVVQNGIEVAEISLPSLRRLFEIAVGAGDRIPPLEKSAFTYPQPNSLVKDENGAAAPAQSTHVTRTLGHHADTPALAHFLGRAPKKRCINVQENEDDPVDIEETSSGSALHPKWRKPYVHRNAARKELDEIVPLSQIPKDIVDERVVKAPDSQLGVVSSTHNAASLRSLAGTRFHIAVRVQVADYSLFMPLHRRPSNHSSHTHRWRLVVSSPSYSLPISSVLRTLTVASVAEAPPPTLVKPVTLSAPPFVVSGIADQPFLARLTFAWAGQMNPVTEVEHWVELDPMQYTTPQLGEMHVFDAELDRHTELLPVREIVKEVEWEAEVRQPSPQETTAEQKFQEQEKERVPPSKISEDAARYQGSRLSGKLPYRRL